MNVQFALLESVQVSHGIGCTQVAYRNSDIKHIRAKPSALSQNLSQLLARMLRCFRVILSTRAKALGVVASSKALGG